MAVTLVTFPVCAGVAADRCMALPIFLLAPPALVAPGPHVTDDRPQASRNRQMLHSRSACRCPGRVASLDA